MYEKELEGVSPEVREQIETVLKQHPELRVNQLTYFQQQASHKAKSNESDVVIIPMLDAIVDCANNNLARFRIMSYWIRHYDCRPIIPGNRIMSDMAKHFGYSTKTIKRHVETISDHHIIGQVLKYHKKEV